MTSRGKIPDAWDDDDWNTQADKPTASEPPVEPKKLSKAERRAQQAALNKKLWDEAEGPDEPYYVQRHDIVPMQSDFKPAVKVLSRKPAPTMIAKKDPATGLEKLTVEDNDDDDEDDGKPKPLTMEERQAKAAKEREEKQRKYEEVRGRLFGTSNPSSGTNTPGNVTPPRGGRGRGRGSGNSRPSSSNGNKGRQLYDPSYTAKPGSSSAQKHSAGQAHSKGEEELVTRQPKAPDGSGRGGFGFATRGRGQV